MLESLYELNKIVNTNNKYKLKELFDNIYPYFWEDNEYAYFNTQDGSKVDVLYYIDGVKAGVEFKRDGNEYLTGGLDQFRIFATVMSTMRDFVKKNPSVDSIEFSALSDRNDGRNSRASLYRKMLQRFANKNGFDFEEKISKRVGITVFILNRKQNKINRLKELAGINITNKHALNEMFDKPYSYKWKGSKIMRGDFVYAMFETKDGHTIEVEFFPFVTGVSDVIGVGFLKDDDVNLTGDRDPFKIFATVIRIICDFIDANHSVERIEFSALRDRDNDNKTKRASLYRKMLNRFLSKRDFEFEERVYGAGDIHFILKRKHFRKEYPVNQMSRQNYVL